MSSRIPKKQHQHVHIVFNERGEGWWIYMTHCAKNQSLTNAPKLMTFQKNSYQFDGTIIIHFQSI